MFRKSRKRRAFTLIELLVVVAIIAVLITVLIPALSRARDRAKTVACNANLRSMGQGLTLYVMNYKYYPCCWAHYPSDYGCLWGPRLNAEFGYGGRHMFKCPLASALFVWDAKIPGGTPATKSEVGFGYQIGDSLLENGKYAFTYGYNDWGWGGSPQKGLGAHNDQATNCELKESLVKKPSDMIAIMDNWVDVRDNIAIPYWTFNVDPHNPAEAPGKRHQKGANVLFADGHTAWYLQTALCSPAGATGGKADVNGVRRMWNNDNEP